MFCEEPPCRRQNGETMEKTIRNEIENTESPVRKNMVQEVRRGDALYPFDDETVKNPPELLYVRGDINLLKSRCVAIVGSRKCTLYGSTVARTLGKRLAENGVTVVSGMAAGIDTAAHQGALEGGGKTIAVLGNGLDICYPRKNQDLMRAIAEAGLLVTEYPEGTGPEAFHFPSRNRLISGLSEAVVIVEAAIRSGSLITAELAAEQNRKLYAVPGNITSDASFGSNKLIYEGCAEALFVFDDILRYLGVDPAGPDSRIRELSGSEEKLYRIIRKNGELTTQDLCRITGWRPEIIHGIITVLEIKGFVATAMGRVFAEPGIR